MPNQNRSNPVQTQKPATSETRRMIRNLEEVPAEPRDALPAVLSGHPPLEFALRRWNLRACHAAVLLLGVMTINLVGAPAIHFIRSLSFIHFFMHSFISWWVHLRFISFGFILSFFLSFIH